MDTAFMVAEMSGKDFKINNSASIVRARGGEKLTEQILTPKTPSRCT